MKRRIFSVCLVMTICFLSLALNANTVSAASTGAITNVCLSSTELHVTIRALGDGLDNPDQIGFVANAHPVVWGTIPRDYQFHTITLTVVLSSAEASAPIFVVAGDGDGSNHAIGLGFGSSTAVRPACPSVLNFTDGRCNQEPYQSVAVYPDNKGGYNFYALFNGVGYFAMHVTEQNLDDNPDTGVTHRIAEAKGAQLFRLAGGGLRVDRMGKDNKMYSFNIGTCGAMED